MYLCTRNYDLKRGGTFETAKAGTFHSVTAGTLIPLSSNNGILYRPDGTKRLADNTLVALTLMIAESKTEEKDVMVKVVVNLINQRN